MVRISALPFVVGVHFPSQSFSSFTYSSCWTRNNHIIPRSSKKQSDCCDVDLLAFNNSSDPIKICRRHRQSRQNSRQKRLVFCASLHFGNIGNIGTTKLCTIATNNHETLFQHCQPGCKIKSQTNKREMFTFEIKRALCFAPSNRSEDMSDTHMKISEAGNLRATWLTITTKKMIIFGLVCIFVRMSRWKYISLAKKGDAYIRTNNCLSLFTLSCFFCA